MSRTFKSERHLALAADFADTRPAVCCNADCDQGRQCPVRDACWLPDATKVRWTPLLLWLLGVPAVVGAIGLLAAFA